MTVNFMVTFLLWGCIWGRAIWYRRVLGRLGSDRAEREKLERKKKYSDIVMISIQLLIWCWGLVKFLHVNFNKN